MHGNNQYYLRAITAEKELSIAQDAGRRLLADHKGLMQSQRYALLTLLELGNILLTRRHRLTSALGRLFRAKEIKEDAVRAMLVSLKTALDATPEDALEPPSPEAASSPEPPSTAS